MLIECRVAKSHREISCFVQVRLPVLFISRHNALHLIALESDCAVLHPAEALVHIFKVAFGSCELGSNICGFGLETVATGVTICEDRIVFGVEHLVRESLVVFLARVHLHLVELDSGAEAHEVNAESEVVGLI